ncbi:hypothetical protein O0L34_g16604 [Tuta absoluta]|nr:hypothetical protein O0L34_g16604 [Tuta absoluta]
MDRPTRKSKCKKRVLFLGRNDRRDPPKPSRLRSRFAAIRRVLRSCFTNYTDFCNETTLHGLKHTVAPHLHWFERVLWVILSLCAFVGAVYCALSQLARYNSEPVVVSLQRDYRNWRTTFPAITACFLNRVDVDKAKDVIEQHWNVTEESDPEKYQYYMSFIELVSDVSFRTNLQNFWKYQTDDTVNDIDLLQLALTVHPTLPLKVMVSQTNKEVQWIPVMTEVGMCMSFNSEYAQFQFMLTDVDWMAEDLLRCHYHQEQCFVRIDSMNNAIRYFVHSPFEISTAISNPTGEINPGEELIINFKTVEIQASPGVKSLRVDQRRCRYPDEWLSNSIQAYSFGLCQMHCRSRMAVMFCGCRPYFHVKGASLGGTTALFVGASVLTVVETGLFIIRWIVSAVVSLVFGRRFRRVRDFIP